MNLQESYQIRTYRSNQLISFRRWPCS